VASLVLQRMDAYQLSPMRHLVVVVPIYQNVDELLNGSRWAERKVHHKTDKICAMGERCACFLMGHAGRSG